MLIFNEFRTKLINSEHVSYYDVELIGDGSSNSVYANFENDAPICIATYPTKEQALQVLGKIAKIHGAANIYYPPKEQENDE